MNVVLDYATHVYLMRFPLSCLVPRIENQQALLAKCHGSRGIVIFDIFIVAFIVPYYT